MAADLIVLNARVLTQDPSRPEADAVAVLGDRIAFVGNEAEVSSLLGDDTTVLDGQGKTLLPGIIDSHFHLLWGSLRLNDLQLGGVRGLSNLKDAIQSYKKAHPDAPWLRGAGLSYDVLGDERLTRQHLDAIEADTPLALTCFDFHTLWCNTAALEAAGLLHGTEVEGNAEVVVDEDGLATGELREFEALDRVYDLIPKSSETERLELLRRGIALANSYGITSVHNMNGDAEEFTLYQKLDEAGELSLRIYMPYRMSPHAPLSALDEAVALRDGYESDFLRAGALKLFMDGVVESYTAFLLEPYANADTKGQAIFEAEQVNEIVRRADAENLQVSVHAVGDAAVRRALNGFSAARRANGVRDSRHRIEHIELLHPNDVRRFGDLGVVASMQPYHCTRPEADYLGSWLKFIPKARYRDSFPWQTLRQAGARLSFGSDWPVVTLNPFVGFDAAVNRQPWAKDLPSEAQTLGATLAAYTTDAAYTEFKEREKGQLKEGLLADMVLLSEDITTTLAENLADLRADVTISGGKIVFQR